MRTRYHPMLRLLHWSMALLIFCMLLIGAGMTSTAGPAYAWLVALHRPLGLLLLALAVIRLTIRFGTGAPALPADMPKIASRTAHLAHWLLYGAMIGLPLIGWAMLSAGGYPVQIAPGLSLPPLTPQNLQAFGLLRLAHGFVAYAFFALVLGHIGAALFHALIRRDGVFDAMGAVRGRPTELPSAEAGQGEVIPASPSFSGQEEAVLQPGSDHGLVAHDTPTGPVRGPSEASRP